MSHIKLGKYNQLEVVKEVDFGVYLNGDEDGEILLPKRYVPEGTKPGDILNVFIYLDMEERLVATTLQPYVQVGEFACLQVAWVNQFGAFLDWGLMKDLFVPFREQKMKMQKGIIRPLVFTSVPRKATMAFPSGLTKQMAFVFPASPPCMAVLSLSIFREQRFGLFFMLWIMAAHSYPLVKPPSTV